MLIKLRTEGNGEIRLVNVPTDSAKQIDVTDNRVVFDYGTLTDDEMSFDSNESAKEALDRIFETTGLSAPFNKTLDLTVTREQELEDSGKLEEEESVEEVSKGTEEKIDE